MSTSRWRLRWTSRPARCWCTEAGEGAPKRLTRPARNRTGRGQLAHPMPSLPALAYPGGEGTPGMSLMRDMIIGHDVERLAFRFTMLDDGDTVQCQISDAAMDDLAGMKGTEASARQAQFLSLRET